MIHPSVTPDDIKALRNIWKIMDLARPDNMPYMYTVPELRDLAARWIYA